MNAVVKFEPKQVALIRNTVAKDANEDEFNLFIEMCKARGLNPLTRQVFCFIFNKDNPKRPRQMTIVVSRDGQRSIAERTGAYRPDDRAPRFEYGEKDPATNPLGLVSAEVTVYKHAHGEWFPVPEIAYYDEYAPIKEIWENNKPTGKFQLDPKKDGWRKMARIMLAKCAEMAALRKAFPDDFGGLYGEGELDRGEVLDLTPSEMAEQSSREDRMAKIGGPNMLVIDWMDGGNLASVPASEFFGKAMDFVKGCNDQPSTVSAFKDRNAASLRQFWGIKPDEALELKKAMEDAISKAVEAA